MSDDDSDIGPDEIYDLSIRCDVVHLHENFPEHPLESCYYWYLYHKQDYSKAELQLQSMLDLSKDKEREAINDASSSTGVPIFDPIDLGVFPAEIWQNITSRLSFVDLSNIRLANAALADIAAECMISTIRFDLSFESLERLRLIASHKNFRKGVRRIVLEAGVLARVGCIHQYLTHYDLDHHANIKPQSPCGHVSPQAQRLYKRNLVKFNKELESKYATYRRNYEAQQRLLNGPKKHLFKCIDDFPNLTAVSLIADQCQHLLSQRFVQRYNQDCAVPVIVSPEESTWELQNIIRPGIKRLSVRSLSPDFFDEDDGRSAVWLQSVFQSLEHLTLQFRTDVFGLSWSIDDMFKDSKLSQSIASATGLRYLSVSIARLNAVGALTNIVPQNCSFAQLHGLDLDKLSATEDELFEMLKNQPALKTLELADVTLSSGSWRSLLKRMRTDLPISSFITMGVLADSNVVIDTDFCEIDAWVSGTRLPLCAIIDMYINDLQDHGFEPEEFELFFNPVNRYVDGDFAPAEELIMDHGPVDDSDMDELSSNDDDDDDDGQEEEHEDEKEDESNSISDAESSLSSDKVIRDEEYENEDDKGDPSGPPNIDVFSIMDVD